MATTVAVVGALAGAYGANRQAKAANAKKSAYTDSVTTQSPYMHGELAPGLEDIINMQRQMVARGAPQVDANGNVTYAPLPGQQDAMDAAAQAVNPSKPNRAAGKGPTTWTNARGETMTLGAGGKAVRGTGTVPGVAKPAGPDLSTPQGIFGEVARRGLDAGNTRTVAGARNMMDNIWGAAGREGSAAEGEQTGFEGYNPVLNRLTGTLEGDVNDRAGRDLLLGFLGETGRGGAANSTGGGGGASPPQYTADGTRVASGGYHGAGYTTAGPGGVQAAPTYSGVPDTMATPSYFGDQTRRIMDEQANEQELQTLIDAMNSDVERGMFRDLAQLDAAASGAGRFGGSTWSALNRDAREEALQEMLKTGSQVRVGDRESRRQARLAALAGVNQRDLGLLGANVQREGIAAGERASSAASGAGAAAAADQIALAKRGQDLSAIGALLENERFSLGQLGDVGGQLSSDRLGSLGMVPGLEGIGMQGLNTALGAGGGLTDLRGQDIGLRQAQIAAGLQRQGLNQQLGMYNASQQQGMVNDYLNTLRGIGGMGGTSITKGVNVQPGAGVSPTGAAVQGAVGGALAGWGAYNQYRGY